MAKTTNQDSLNSSFLETSDEKFIESFSSKKRRRQKEDVLDLTYLNEEVKEAWIYPLTTLTGKSAVEGIRISNEKTTIMVTTPDKGKKIKVYLEQVQAYSLNEFTDPVNPTEQLIKNSNTFNLTTLDFPEVNFNLLYLLTFEELTKDNLNSVKQYLGETIFQNPDSDQVEMTFTPIEEFSSLFQSKPIKIAISEPILAKIKEIHVTTPVGTLISKIKVIDEEGFQPDLMAKEGTEIFPKLVFPFQTQPHLATVEYWASRQIIPLKDIFDFLDNYDNGEGNAKGKKYNEEFSLANFLKLGVEAGYPSFHVNNAKKIRFKISKINFKENLNVGSGWKDVESNFDEYLDFDIDNPNTKFLKLEPTSGSTLPAAKIVASAEDNTIWKKGSEEYHIDAKELKIKEPLFDIDIYPTGIGKITSAFQAVCDMLTESFWKDMEFEGATKFEKKDDQKIVSINDESIYKLQEKYSGQDRYAITTNVWIAWKRKNPDLVNANPDIIKRIENVLAMLSAVIKSNYSINKGDNDDYQILLPYYFEIQNKLDNPTSYVNYKDIVVKLKSRYGEFTENWFNFTNKNISKATIFELEYNHFVFPELTKKVETASIPSSMPLDQELANGEFSKYMMQNFAKDTQKKKIYLERYGSGKMHYEPAINNLENEGEFELNDSINVAEIEISAFYGFGKWNFKFVTDEEKPTNFDLSLSLFDKYNNSQTLVNLIL